jgi:hypothetical protein
MAVTRREFITTAAAASALAGLPAAGLLASVGPASAASPAGDVVGKITVGYQGWFACAGDGAPINGWWHWSQNWSQTPSPSNNVIKAWPDLREYAHVYPTGYANLGNGQPASLFSSYDQQTVDTHFSWMQQNDCDTAALQRFNPNSSEGPTRDAMAGIGLLHGRRIHRVHLRSGLREHRDDHGRDHVRALRPPDLHRQHRLAGGASLRVPDLRHLTAT